MSHSASSPVQRRGTARSSSRYGAQILLHLALTVAVFMVGVGVGSVQVDPKTIFDIILHQTGLQTLSAEHATELGPLISIIWDVRLPRVITAFVVGAALSLSGAVMQSILRNPLASSYTIGVSSGASLGAAFAVTLGMGAVWGIWTLPLAGAVTSVLTVILVMALASKLDRNMENHTIILVGMVMQLFFGGILTLLMSLSRETMQTLVLWQMGSFQGLGWRQAAVIIPILLVLGIVIWSRSHTLDLLSFGEHQAFTMGVNVRVEKPILLFLAAVLTGSAISFAGVIGFIDLAAPHVVRRIYGAKHRLVLPMSALWGGVFMVLSDLVSRTLLSPRELPVGAITAIAGAPFFWYIFFRSRKERGAL